MHKYRGFSGDALDTYTKKLQSLFSFVLKHSLFEGVEINTIRKNDENHDTVIQNCREKWNIPPQIPIGVLTLSIYTQIQRSIEGLIESGEAVDLRLSCGLPNPDDPVFFIRKNGTQLMAFNTIGDFGFNNITNATVL